jgi:hypothetical protein
VRAGERGFETINFLASALSSSKGGKEEEDW